MLLAPPVCLHVPTAHRGSWRFASHTPRAALSCSRAHSRAASLPRPRRSFLITMVENGIYLVIYSHQSRNPGRHIDRPTSEFLHALLRDLRYDGLFQRLRP